ncbi:MAG: tRNA 5'-guanylyltransferase [Methanosarcinales archaeon]|nr:tRNA 5'-guanylyltransferase [Methanosarcinales archaeon]
MERTLRESKWEIFSSIRTRAPFFVRADGRGFSKLLSSFEKPYDVGFARAMSRSARSLMEESGLSPSLAFLISDEINLLFLDHPFNGRVEKLDSVVAGFLSGALSLSLGQAVSMDARVIPVCPGEILEYLGQGQDEAWRNHVFSCGFYSLLEEGMSNARAMDMLRGMKESQIHELLFQRGQNLARSPSWQRRGTLVYRRDGSVVEDWEIPLFRSPEGEAFLQGIISKE